MKRIVFLGLLVAGFVGAQTVVNQGKPGTQGSWPVVISGTVPGAGSVALGPDGGAVPVQIGRHAACTNTTMNVGTTGTACPATARADRNFLLVQLVQTGETLTITSDGVTAATATVGAQVTDGNVYTDNLGGAVAANCRCSAATCSVRIVECP